MGFAINTNNLELFVEADGLATNAGAVTAWFDLSGKGRDLLPVRAGSYPIHTDNVVNGKATVKWLGGGVAPLGTNTSFTVRSGFMVARINAATFSTHNGLLTSFINYPILVGNGPNTTVFFDALYDLYEYRLNDVIYSPLDTWAGGKLTKAHTPPAPLNAFGIIYFRFWKNLIVDGIQIGADRASTIRNLVGEVAHLSLYSKDFGCEPDVRAQMLKLSTYYGIPIAEVYPFSGSRGDTTAGGKNVLSDGQLEPVTSIISSSRRTFGANFSLRNVGEVKAERAFYEAKYPTGKFLYRDYNIIPPEDTLVRYNVPQAKEFAESLNASSYSREFVQTTGTVPTFTAT